MPDQHVMFQSIGDFVAELKSLGSDGLAEKFVRAQIEKEEINAAYSKYCLRTAYMTAEGDLHELLMSCGVSPAKVNSGNRDGEEVAKELLAELTSQLEAMQLSVRRGMFVS